MSSIEELTDQCRAEILATIMDMGRSPTVTEYVARNEISRLSKEVEDLRTGLRLCLENLDGIATGDDLPSIVICAKARALLKGETDKLHASDCALHNAPALPVGPCDCGAHLQKGNEK